MVQSQTEVGETPRILQGQLMAFFAFDIGYEVSLEEVDREEPGVNGAVLSRSLFQLEQTTIHHFLIFVKST